ncbi:MAG: hypothetical protein KGD64_04770 [Candidatus Heimdallarchaeota archaeon]|nr:hypothetical protein [Candidatus Heimdallarchaeota archaeon]
MIRLDSSLLARTNEFVTSIAKEFIPQASDFIKYFGEENLSIDVYSSVHFLRPTDFTVKSLTKEDKADLEQLYSACEEIEVDEAWVLINHPQVVGCYYKDLLVSAASATHYWANFADLGIITHPDFRGKGLGKVVVSALTESVLKETNKIPLY